MQGPHRWKRPEQRPSPPRQSLSRHPRLRHGRRATQAQRIYGPTFPDPAPPGERLSQKNAVDLGGADADDARPTAR